MYTLTALYKMEGSNWTVEGIAEGNFFELDGFETLADALIEAQRRFGQQSRDSIVKSRNEVDYLD